MNEQLYAILEVYAEDMRKMEERQAEFLSVDARSWDFDSDEDPESKNYRVANGIAIYDIRGKMLNERNLFTRIFGITTYEDIIDDFMAIMADDEVEKTLVSMGTPGGAVAGISEVADAWSRLDQSKAITVHTPSHLASAGIWLASNSSGGIYASETAEVGSIGVIMQHISREGMLDKAGIKVTQIKSSPLKAIGSPDKDLTEQEEAHLKKKVDETAGLFRKQIYRTRPNIQEEAFSGEMFIASEAVRIGLIDGVKNFSDVFSTMAIAAGTSNNNLHTGRYDMKTKVTAAMFDAAVDAGTDPSTLEVVSQEEWDKLQAGKEKVTQEMFDSKVKGGADPSTLEVVSQEEWDKLHASDDDPTETLNAEIKDLTSKLAEANDIIAGLEADLAAAKADSGASPLRAFALERLGVMRVALGLQKIDMSEFSDTMLAQEYGPIDKAFKKAYKSGGHTKPNTGQESAEKAEISSVDNAKLNSVF